MAQPFVVDASVFVNAFVPSETGHEQSHRFLQQQNENHSPVLAPTLLLPEIAAAIGREKNDPILADQFIDSLIRLQNLTLVPLDVKLGQTASSIAAHNRLRGSDAVYTAVAVRYGCGLVTLDSEQYARAADAVPTYYPKDVV